MGMSVYSCKAPLSIHRANVDKLKRGQQMDSYDDYWNGGYNDDGSDPWDEGGGYEDPDAADMKGLAPMPNIPQSDRTIDDYKQWLVDTNELNMKKTDGVRSPYNEEQYNKAQTIYFATKLMLDNHWDACVVEAQGMVEKLRAEEKQKATAPTGEAGAPEDVTVEALRQEKEKLELMAEIAELKNRLSANPFSQGAGGGPIGGGTAGGTAHMGYTT